MGKKKLSFSLEEDFVVKLFEDGVLLSEYSITGLEEVLKGKWSEYNLTGVPKVNVAVHLENSGIVEIKTPTATCEESHLVNETRKVPRVKNTTNITANSTDIGIDQTNDTTDENTTIKNTTKNRTTLNKSKEEEFDVEIIQVRKKKKHDKKLVITQFDYKPKPLCPDGIKAVKQKLETMAAKEHEVQAVNEMKNELEATIYGARDKLESDSITKVSTAEQRDEVTKLCADIEEWTYEGSTEKSEYEKRLENLRGLLGPMEERATELEARADLPDVVQESIDDMNRAKAMIKKNMTWVNETKIEKAQEKLTEFVEWWSQRQEKQRELPLSEAPAFTKADVVDRLSKVQKEWEKLKKIKKPKEPTKKKEEEKDGKKEEGLPKTVEETEKELGEVKKAKADAIENEDYDKAQMLKKKQETLSKHLAQLKDEKSEL